MAYTPKKVSVTIPSFKFGTAKYIQGLQTAKDNRATKKRTEARLDLQDQRQLRQDELTRMRLQRRDKAQDEQWKYQNKAQDTQREYQNKVAAANKVLATARENRLDKATDLKNTLAAEKLANQATINRNSFNPVVYTEDDYPPEELRGLNNLRNEQGTAVTLFSGTPEDLERNLENAGNAYKTSIENRYKLSDVVKKVQKHKLELRAYYKLLNDETTPDGDKALIKKFVDTMYTPRIETIKQHIANGDGLSLGQERNILGNRVIPDSVKSVMLKPDYINNLLSSSNAPTRASLIANEAVRQKTLNAQQISRISKYSKAVQRINKSTKTYGKGFSSSVKGIRQALHDIANVDIGSGDNKRVVDGYNVLVNTHHISPEVAAMVIGSNIQDGLTEKWFPEVTDDLFTTITEQAQALQAALSGTSDGKGGTVYAINPQKLKYHTIKNKSPEFMLAQRLYANTDTNAQIPLSEEVRKNIRTAIANNPALSGANSPLFNNLQGPPPPSGSNIDTRSTRLPSGKNSTTPVASKSIYSMLNNVNLQDKDILRNTPVLGMVTPGNNGRIPLVTTKDLKARAANLVDRYKDLGETNYVPAALAARRVLGL